MAPKDLWHKTHKTADGKTEKVRSKRYGRGSRWRVSFVNPETGLPATQAFDRFTDATTFENNIKADISRGQFVDPVVGRQLVRDYAEAWRLDQLHSPRTRENVENCVRLHINPVLGHLAMAAVRSSHIKRWVNDRREVLSASTLRVQYVSVLAPMFKQAVIDRVIGFSPCTGVRLPEVEDVEYFIPPVQKIYDLAAALPDRLRPVPLIAAGMGWRGGEIFGAELNDATDRTALDFLARVGRVRQQINKVGGEPPYLDTPKTGMSVRTNDLPDVVAEAVSEHIRLFPPKEIEVVDKSDPRAVVVRKVRLLFTSGWDLPMYGAKWASVWPDAVKKVGLPQGFGLHGLRHFFATALIYGGASVKTVQVAMGHSKPSITLDRYTSYWPDAMDSGRSVMNDALKIPTGRARAIVG
ncbi:MAG: tyrosine-type recombinase/integrase [Umezawaea sp.]